MEWHDLSRAKDALHRIKEHYLWYQDQDSWPRRKEVPEPEWHKGMKYQCCLKFVLDNGNEVEFGAPWCGYFEKLLSAKIVTVEEENDMEIHFD